MNKKQKEELINVIAEVYPEAIQSMAKTISIITLTIYEEDDAIGDLNTISSEILEMIKKKVDKSF
jgi:hypothetical protein